MSDYRVRAMTPADEPKIRELFHVVFGGVLTPAEWQWEFPGNPFSRPIVYLAVTDDERIVGHYSLIPLPFRMGGRDTLAALSVQSMIHPDFQKRGILKALAAAAEKQLDADGVEVGVTFLNDNSLHAYTTHFGWTELRGPNFIYFTVLRSEGVFERALKVRPLAKALAVVADPVASLVFRPSGAAPAGLTITQVDRFDERADALWHRFSRGLGGTVTRTARYLNWRTADKPADYALFIAEERGTLVGLAITKVDQRFGLRFGYLAELLFEPDRPEVGRALAARGLETLKAGGCSMASAVTSGSPAVLRALRGSGFWRLPRRVMPHGIHFCFKLRKSGDAATPPGGGWFLSWLDHDVV